MTSSNDANKYASIGHRERSQATHALEIFLHVDIQYSRPCLIAVDFHLTAEAKRFYGSLIEEAPTYTGTQSNLFARSLPAFLRVECTRIDLLVQVSFVTSFEGNKRSQPETQHAGRTGAGTAPFFTVYRLFFVRLATTSDRNFLPSRSLPVACVPPPSVGAACVAPPSLGAACVTPPSLSGVT